MTAVVLNRRQAIVDLKASQHRFDHVVVPVEAVVTCLARLVDKILALKLGFLLNDRHLLRWRHPLVLECLLLLQLLFALLSGLFFSQFRCAFLLTLFQLFSLFRLYEIITL